MPNDNLVDDYLQAPEPSYEEAMAAARSRQGIEEQRRKELTAKLEVEEEMEKSWIDRTFTAKQEAEDGFWNNVDEVVGTAIEGAEEQIVRSLGDMANALTNFEDESTLSLNAHYVFGDGEFMGDIGFKIPFTNKQVGIVSAKKFSRMRDLYEISTGDKAATLSNFDIDDVDRPDSVAGEFGANMIKWFTVFAATRKAMGAGTTTTSSAAKGFAAGALTDFAAFDPHEERLSNLLIDMGGEDSVFSNAVTEYLAADVADSALEGRLKNAIEGSVLGSMTDGLFSAIKWLRVRQKQRQFSKIKTESTSLKEDATDDVAGEVTDDVVEETTTAAKEVEEVSPLDGAKAEIATPESAAKDALEPSTIHTTVKDHLGLKTELSENAVETLAKNIQEGNLAEASQMVHFNESRIDWDTMDDKDSIQQLFYAFEDAASDMLGEAAGGPVSLKTTKTIAEDIGFTAENADSLFKTLKSSGSISARMFAAHQSMVASGRHLNKLAKIAKETNSNEDIFKLHRHIELHAALMAQVKGSQSEIARSLSAMRLMKDATAESFREFDQVKKAMGGHKDTQAVIDSVLAGKEDLRALNKVVNKTAGRKMWDIISEVAINGLLSSPKTHIINITSNAGMLIVGPMERYIAAGVGRFSKRADKVTLREANEALIGQFKSVTSAYKLAVQAAKEGRPISDVRQRIEFDTRKAIKSSGTGNVARAINLIGETVRLPGRALLAGDEFFKTISKQSEMHAQAYRFAARNADEKVFKTKAKRETFIKSEMARLMRDPSSEMEAASLRFARRQTFQENAETTFGPKVEGLLNFHPAFKLLVSPFVRTPMNLLRQSFVDRNPLLFAMVQKNRDILRQGGPAAQAVIARTVTGVGAWATAYSLVGSGLLTGKGESFSNTEKLDKIPEYSIKLGDKYYSYNRLDPVGSMIGLVADTEYAFRHGYDPDDPDSSSALFELTQAVGLAFMQNALNKTWMRSFSDLMETATVASEGSSASAQRAIQKLLADQIVKATPFSSALRSYTQSTDEVVREAWEVKDRLFRNLPGLSDDLPPVRDLLGRPVTRDNAEWFWINPFGANPESDNPVDQELARLAFDPAMVQKSVQGVQLTAAQYSELKGYIGDMGGRGPTFEEQLSDIFANSAYQQATDPMKIQIVKNLLRQRKQSAEQILLLNNEELRAKTMDAGVRKAAKLSGRDIQQIRKELGLK